MNGFSVTISDTQTLQRLRRKITRTSKVLTSCLNVAGELERHCRKLDDLNAVAPSHEVLKAIRVYATTIEHHHQNIDMIMQTLRGTGSVVSLYLDL
jgi:hypothetical protein